MKINRIPLCFHNTINGDLIIRQIEIKYLYLRTKFFPMSKATILKEEPNKIDFEDFKKEVLADFRLASISREASLLGRREVLTGDRKSTRLNSSHVRISYAVFCLKKKK